MSDYQLVDLDVEQIQQQLQATFSRFVTELEVHVWLRQTGFVPFNQSWVADDRALSSLDQKAVRRTPTFPVQ